MRSMLEEALETLVRRATDADAGTDLGRAREAFHERTGPFAPGDSFYEPRIRFFLDWYLVAWTSADGSRPADRAARSEAELMVARALRQPTRGLFRVHERDPIRVTDLLGGARYRITSELHGGEPLRAGDVLDAHLVVLGDRIHLMPGRIFHPAEAHEPLAAVVARARAEQWERTELLDGLLRIRMRLDRFTSMRARHVYRFEALSDRDILSAAWARRA